MTERAREIWKSLTNIVEHGENYEVSNLGNVRRIGSKNPRKLVKDKDEYLTINLSKKGKVKGYKVHRLVALAFIPNPDNKPEVNHKDNSRSNNVFSNLEWSNRDENMSHAKNSGNMKGTVKKGEREGEKNASAKLTESDIYEIVDDWNTGLYTYTSLGRKYNMSRKAISAIVKRESWKHLDLDIKFTKTRGTGIYERK